MAVTNVNVRSTDGAGVDKAKADVDADAVAASFFAFALGQGPQWWSSLSVTQKTGSPQQLAQIMRYLYGMIKELKRDLRQAKIELAALKKQK